MAPAAVRDRGEDDPLIKVRRGRGRWERGQQTDQPGRPAELRGARGAGAEVAGESPAVRIGQFVEQVRGDERARGGAVERIAIRKAGHTLYITKGRRKVAAAASSELNPVGNC